MKPLPRVAVLLLLCWPASARAQVTTFRVTEIQDAGQGKVKVDLTLQQGSRAASIDVWVNSVLPAHRNWVSRKDKGPAVETGMHLGTVAEALAARQSRTDSYVLDLKTLNDKFGVEPGSTLYFSIKLPSSFNGGHEWGVNGGGSYSTGTSCVIPSSCQIPGAAATPKASASQRCGCLNVNSASARQLEALPGIGPSLAARIVAQRASQGRFTSVNDLARVKGIGPGLMRRLAPMVKVSGRSTGLGRSSRR